jgi:hypothetical protein
MELKDLVGKHTLYGIEVGEKEFETRWDGIEERCYVKFTLDGIHYLAVENPSDGYRSYMEDLQTTDDPCEIPLPNVEVVCHMEEDDEWDKNDILVFVDAANGKEILRIGTGKCDDYYPYCEMEYTPENMSCNERRS